MAHRDNQRQKGGDDLLKQGNRCRRRSAALMALSVPLARRLTTFVAGFVRGDTFTVYSGMAR